MSSPAEFDASDPNFRAFAKKLIQSLLADIKAQEQQQAKLDAQQSDQNQVEELRKTLDHLYHAP